MAARVVFTSGLSRLYPGLGEHLVEEATVAIDGAIHETPYFQRIRPGCEVFFIPKLKGEDSTVSATFSAQFG
jgi:hypothetical protein